MSLLDLRGITKTYSDGHEALRGVDLALDEGMFGLLGPNGAGKTTLLQILVLALEPTSGTRSYEGLDPKTHRKEIRRSIGYLPQDFQPIRHLTGTEYLVHCARLRSVPLTRRELDGRARRLLDAVDLQDAANRPAGEYSGGMRRRLGIAQAMIHAPRLLVIDEPTAGLDAEERVRFRNLIAEVAEEIAVLLSTHICEDIEATCDRIGVLAGGRMIFDGPPGALMRGAGTLEEAYAAELLRERAA
ncbi:MAG TPA: ATP-binding cassette domain-containing protein [Thermoanaerobaculia bacterium]|nr:ATP-binding cassette domain-containing protein [Thermoanaerobaculia bacterium]